MDQALYWADILAGYAFTLMQDYLTDIWGVSFTRAAGILNVWEGISSVFPLFLLFIVDVRLGNFRMLVCSSVAYCAGIGLVTISTPPVLSIVASTCKNYEPRCIGCVHKVIFFIGMALIVVGKAGYRTSVGLFIQEQNDNPIDKDTIEIGKDDMLGKQVVQEGKDTIQASQEDQPADVE